MGTEKLMRRLDRLDHNERVAELIAHARSLTPSDADALVRELSSGDTHRRWLALRVVAVRGDTAQAWAALGDPSLLVRSGAAKLVGRLADSVPVGVLDQIDEYSLKLILREVVRRRRADIAEGLVTGLLERQRLREAAYLLGSCSPAWIEARLDAAPWPESVWTRLARYRAELVCAHIESQFVDAQRPDLVWRRYPPAMWTTLCETSPGTVASWLDRFAESDLLPSVLHCGGITHLVRNSTARVVGWLSTRSAELAQMGLPWGLLSRVGDVDDEVLTPLCQVLAQSRPGDLGRLLARLPYSRRTALFERATADIATATVEWPIGLLSVLPTPLRDREAARMLGLVAARTDGTLRRKLLGLRAIEVARAELEREGQSSDATERGEAHAALVMSTSFSRTGMAETLAWLQRIHNDQDPVRHAVLDALAEVPARQLTDAVALDAVVAPIFDARDTSHATRGCAAQIARRLLVEYAGQPAAPMFSLGLSLLERLAGQSGSLGLPRLDGNLPRGAEQAIVAALWPWLEAAQWREQHSHVFHVWSVLGERAWRVDRLGALIGKTIWQGDRRVASQAASLWLQDPATRDERVRELVRRDRSALYVPAVFEHCHRRRQTLLVGAFRDSALQGRFHDGSVVRIPSVGGGFQRWPSEVQREYVQLIRLAEEEPKRFSRDRAALVAMRARVPITTVADLGDALAHKDIHVCEAALGASVWTDVPIPALPILLDHLDGDRARVAMYALPRLARIIPRNKFVDALVQVLARPQIKITVHKEVLRLLGELATPRAMDVIRDQWRQPLHRVVRIAALHVARNLLGQPESWAMLAGAAQDESSNVACAVIVPSPSSIADVYRRRYLQTMLTLAEHPSPVVREALFAALSGGWSSVDPEQSAAVASRMLVRLDPLDPWWSASAVVAEVGRSEAAHGLTLRLVDELVTAADRDVAPASERDRLAHQRLRGVLEALSHDRHPTTLVLLDALAIRLSARPGWFADGARLRFAAAPNDRLGVVTADLLSAAPSPRCGVAVEHAAGAAAADEDRRWTPESAGDQVAAIAGGPPAARMVAVALVSGFGPRWWWGEVWIEWLARLREDPDLDVRTAAREVWVTAS